MATCVVVVAVVAVVIIGGCGGGTDDPGCQVSDLSEVAQAAKTGQWKNVGSGAEYEASWSWDLSASDPEWLGAFQDALKMGFSLVGPLGEIAGEVAAEVAPEIVQRFSSSFDDIENDGADSKSQSFHVPNQERGVIYQWQWLVECKGKNNSFKTKDFQVMQSQVPCCLPGQFKKNGDPLQGCKNSKAHICEVTTTTPTTTTLEPCPRDDGVKSFEHPVCFGTAPKCEGVKSDCWHHGMVYVKSDNDCQGAEKSCWISGQKVVCHKIHECCDGYHLETPTDADPKCVFKDLSSTATRRRQSGLMQEVENYTSTRMMV